MDDRTLFVAGKGTVVVVTHKYRPVTEYLGDCSDGMFHFEDDVNLAVAFANEEEAVGAAAKLEQTWGSIYRITTKVARAPWYQDPPPYTQVAAKIGDGLRRFFGRYDVVTPEMRLAARRW
jgi:hypothetical protein